MVGMDPGTGKGPMSNNEPIKDVFAISGAFESEREEKGDARDTWDQLQEKPSGLREVPDLFDFHLRKLASSAEESARDERDSSEASLPREFRIADMCGKRGMSAYSGQCG